MTGLKLNKNRLNSHSPCRFRIPFGIRLAFLQANMYVESVEDEHYTVRSPSWKCFRELHDWNTQQAPTLLIGDFFPPFKLLHFIGLVITRAQLIKVCDGFGDWYLARTWHEKGLYCLFLYCRKANCFALFMKRSIQGQQLELGALLFAVAFI